MSLGRVVRTQIFLVAFVLVIAGFNATKALGQDPTVPKVDVFAGYQWLNPGGDVATANDVLTPFKLPSAASGFGTSVTYNYFKHVGLTADFGANYSNAVIQSTLSIGPRYMWRTEGINVFVQTLLGLNSLNVSGLPGKNGIGAVLGGGIDIPVTKKFSWRLVEADYVWSRHNYADVVPDATSKLRHPELHGVRLRSGIVFNMGGEPELAPAVACAAQPSQVMVGEPVTVTVTPSNFNAKHKVASTYSSTGGRVTPKDSAATVDTAGMTGGSYTVTATATDAKLKKNNVASCSASFVVKELPKNPPN